MKPLIGITPCALLEVPQRDWIYNPHDYSRAVQRAGGIPVLLPFVETDEAAAEVLARVDGLLLSGGEDLDPLLFGEMPHPQTGAIDPLRDTSELAYARVAMAQEKPVLGICRGHQVLAVAFGGTLWQDIPSQLPQAMKHAAALPSQPKWYPTHPVRIEPETRLAALLGTSTRVNSRHHQSVKDLPPGWVLSATAPDGVIEAMEHPTARFALSVQWHPENFQGRDFNFDTLFRAFVDASK